MRRTLVAAAVTLAVAAALIGAIAGPAEAAPAGNQFYYTVTASYQGAPENLWEVATRFLGDERRAGEILGLNSGRVQPDGSRLQDPSNLRAGWNLVLPWDAVGADLHYGALPADPGTSSDCAQQPDVPDGAAWGQTLLAPSAAWPVTDGSGVTVAVVGSGVDGDAAELSGRVAAGTDIAGSSGRGDDGCAGSGTALAGIVAGDDRAGGKTFGVAPGARIVPVKVGTGGIQTRIAATGIHVAGVSGAKVILVGAGVHAADPEVRAAISDAISRDVVVVVPASAAADPADGLLRVGAIGEDRKPADNYPAGDLLAPGVGVASIGQAGSGAEFAAAFVAGTVALVRAAHPDLHAADVTRQVLHTATGGIVGPAAAVTTPVAASAAAAAPASALGTLGRVLLWVAVGLAVLLVLVLLLGRPARMLIRVTHRVRASRQAKRARARLADDSDDPFWEPPASRAVPDDVTQELVPRS